MAWQGSTRRATLPPEWPAIQQATLERDPICTCESCPACSHPDACTRPSTEADHYGHRDDHTRTRGLCSPCHAHRSGKQGAAARAQRQARARRPPTPHPGVTS